MGDEANERGRYGSLTGTKDRADERVGVGGQATFLRALELMTGIRSRWILQGSACSTTLHLLSHHPRRSAGI